LLEALWAVSLAERPAGDESVLEVAGAARAAVKRSTRTPTVADLLLAGFATRATGPYAEAVPPLRRAVDMLRDGETSDDERLRWLGLGWVAASELLEEAARDLLARQWVHLAREQGALTRLSQALIVLGVSEAWAGRLDASDGSFAERRDINDAIGFAGTGGRTSPHQAIVYAWRGREAEARALADEVILEATANQLGGNVSFTDYALSVLEVGLGRYDAACSCALRVFERDPPYSGVRVLPELIEAAVRTGDHDAATAALARLSERAQATGTAWALGLLARCRAQLSADEAETEALYREAIGLLHGGLLAPERSRSHLLFGEWLRRQRRRREAREQLRIAYDMFERIGGEGFAERARVELLATGARARQRVPATRGELTQQEARIAGLAAEGETNAEIAAQMFISPNTVEYHLRKVFRKLDVRSRTQLARKMLEKDLNLRSPVD
jgi:DNA-binding CsgD family transcriptional regulator